MFTMIKVEKGGRRKYFEFLELEWNVNNLKESKINCFILCVDNSVAIKII
jgi:hypothetical protein